MIGRRAICRLRRRGAPTMIKRSKNESGPVKKAGQPSGGPQIGLFGQRYGLGLLEGGRAGTGAKRRGKMQGRQKALFSNVPELAWMKDSGGRFISASAPFANACGVSHRDLIGKTDWDIWPRRLAGRYAAQDRKVLGSGRPDRAVIGSARGPGGGQWSEIVKMPLFGQDGRVSGTLGIARDISAQKQAAGQLRLMARQVIRAREDEKKRITNVLHDELGSHILLLNSSLSIARQEVLKSDPNRAAARLEETTKAVQTLAGTLRRICFDIRPPAMGVSGLAGAVTELAARTGRCTGIKTQCSLRLPNEKRIDDLVKIMAYRIIQESLNNAVKHSGARMVKIGMHCAARRLKFSIADDGRGFDAEDPLFLKRNPTLGLRIMREEAESLYASLSVDSAPGFGTVVKGDFPLDPGLVKE